MGNKYVYVKCLEAWLAQSKCYVSIKNHYDDCHGGSVGGGC